MIEDMEAELNESSEINSKTDNLAITEEADVDEAFLIFLLKVNINKFEKRNEVDTT